MKNLKTVLSFMQYNDKNGMWNEWYDEIQQGDSTFDKQYVISVLTDWYNDSTDEKYLRMLSFVETL
ncbi:hypothetical protein [Paenibacillus sp. MMO-58]|uniref:hypothetical protein n=1 Tax=Paenibacillus sp. MMO-58 TaxID=3081290 RepID=UPI00301A90E7